MNISILLSVSYARQNIVLGSYVSKVKRIPTGIIINVKFKKKNTRRQDQGIQGQSPGFLFLF